MPSENVAAQHGQPFATDEKYLVFKRDEFIERHGTSKVVEALDDAVVIRTQDVFAAAGLSAYAHNIRAAIALLGDFWEYDEGLEAIAKYFEGVAQEAADRLARGECKLPD